MTESALSDHERLLRTALRLFAELGYDQTTNRMITDATGLDPSAVTDLFGGKRDLYLSVIQLVHDQEQALLERMSGAYTHDRAGVHRMVDEYFDYFLDYPQTAALWMHRRMHDASDLRHIEQFYSFPQIKAVAELTRGLFPDDVDIELIVWNIVWSVQTFVYGGVPDAHGGRLGRDDPQAVQRFRHHLHSCLDHLMLPGA